MILPRSKILVVGWLMILLLLCGGRAIGADAADRPPNVLLIIADDLNPSLGCYGNSTVQTPNMDRLAARGVRFTRAYAPWASCLISRYAFLSGWQPAASGGYNYIWPDSRTGPLQKAVYLPQHFQSQGYVTARLDKVFHIGKDDPQSWTITEEPHQDAKGKFQWVRTGEEITKRGLQGKVVREGKYPQVTGEQGQYAVVDAGADEFFDGITARRAVEVLEQQAKAGGPFFLAVGFRRPHLPWIAPQQYFDRYPPANIPLPPRAANGKQQPVAEDVHRAMIAHYYAATTFVDDRIGEVLNALERLKLTDRTLVVLLGDNGYCLGERGSLFGKGNLWERSLHVPLIMAGPGLPAGQQRDVPVSLVDLYPTLVDLCRLPRPPTRLDGDSLQAVLAGDVSGWREGTLSFYAAGENTERCAGLAASLRTARFRYTVGPACVPVEMMDMVADPDERRNLIGDDRFRAERERLHAQVSAALARAVPASKPVKVE